MDLKRYYQELRKKEAEIEGKDIYVVSLDTPDGGKAGVITQVPKTIGCKLIVEGRARLATPEEVEQFEKEEAEKRAEFQNQEFARKIQVQVVAEPRPARSGKERP
ncbi:MAG: hypothetical protein KatS3mg004_0439 [Bryobacteraceae bacterium]|nr:MAG: hypothetical protein KatS3mg004_0439 [Bryobacteraceae bacterium]